MPFAIPVHSSKHPFKYALLLPLPVYICLHHLVCCLFSQWHFLSSHSYSCGVESVVAVVVGGGGGGGLYELVEVLSVVVVMIRVMVLGYQWSWL